MIWVKWGGKAHLISPAHQAYRPDYSDVYTACGYKVGSNAVQEKAPQKTRLGYVSGYSSRWCGICGRIADSLDAIRG